MSIRIVLSRFYLLIFYFEKFSTWIWRLPFAAYVNLKLSNKPYNIENTFSARPQERKVRQGRSHFILLSSYTTVLRRSLFVGSLNNDDDAVNENGKKKNRFWLAKQQLCTCTSRFFVHFLAVVVSSRTGTQATTFLFFSWTFIQSFRIQLQTKLPTFDELIEMEWAR